MFYNYILMIVRQYPCEKNYPQLSAFALSQYINCSYEYYIIPVLFNFYRNDLFLFIKQAPLYDYAEDNILSYFPRSMRNLVNTLQTEMGIALFWLEQNEIIANPEKFHAIILRKNKANTR